LALILQLNCAAACLIDCGIALAPAVQPAAAHCHTENQTPQSNPSDDKHDEAGCDVRDQVAVEKIKVLSNADASAVVVFAETHPVAPIASHHFHSFWTSAEVVSPPFASSLILRI
jgi:hypothetical protein